MTQHSSIRRIGWIAALAICTALYLMLHLRVHAVHSEVVGAEREIVQLEREILMLETEFAVRSNQLQLASWNRVDFGFTSPSAEQFVENERQLASFGTPRGPGAPEPIRVASRASGGETQPFPQMVSPLTGEPIDAGLIDPAAGVQTARADDGMMRIPLNAVMVAGQ